MNYKVLLVSLIAIVMFSACESLDSDLEPNYNNENGSKNFKVNSWVKSEMDYYYYWNDKIPNENLLDFENFPNVFFESLLYKSIDKWSYITDDYTELTNSKKSATTSTGIVPLYTYLDNSNQVYAVILYTKKGSPAENKGLKRGNIIETINGTKINEVNYETILQQDSMKLTVFKNADSVKASTTPDTISISSEAFANNPVIFDSIYNIDNKSIGYIVFDDYSELTLFKSKMSNILDTFKTAGVNNLILDLRYNGGGLLSSAQWLMSAIAPKEHSINEDVIISLEYNKTINETEYVRFIETDYDFNFDNIIFLMNEYTASASELTIVGLQPYIQSITTIGNTTVGKCYASFPIYDPENLYSYNYGIQPIVSKYINSEGFTDFTNGLIPDLIIKEFFDNTIYEFGDTENEPFLNTAINKLTLVTKSAIIKDNNGNIHTLLPNQYLNTNKNLIIDIPSTIPKK